MICYKLQSCRPEEYPDITNLCLDFISPDTNKLVYINGDPSQVYRLVLVGENLCICNDFVPPYVITLDDCVPQERKCYQLQACDEESYIIDTCLDGLAVVVGSIIEIDTLGRCFTVLAQTPDNGQGVLTVTAVIVDCAECQAGQGKFYLVENCQTQETFTVEINGAGFAIGNVIEFIEIEGCWLVISEVGDRDNIYTLAQIHKDCEECLGKDRFFFRVQSCLDGSTNSVEVVGGAVVVGDVITVSENNHCWKLIAPIAGGISTFTFVSKLQSCDECEPSNDCGEDGERTLAYATMVQLPEPTIPDKGFKECCYTNLVLGSRTDNDPYKNDFTGYYFKKQTSGDDCEFILHELKTGDTYALDNDTYGKYKAFSDISEQPDLTTYIVEWRKVLATLGEGLYRVEQNITIAGLTFSQMSNTFTLQEFSDQVADKTVRIDAKMDGTLVHYEVDFKGSDFQTSIRTNGFFGRRNPKYKQDNLVKRNYDTVQISMSQENEYQLQAGLVPECITTEIYDFILFGNELFVSDYNLINHSYKFRLYEVELDSNKGAKYYTTNRDSRLNLTFIDRIKNKRKLNC